VIGYAVNPYLRLKVQRESSGVSAMSLSAPVPGRGLQFNELKRGSHGEEMDTLVNVLCQLRRPEFLRALSAETSGALLDIGVLVPAAAPPNRPQFSCALEPPPNAVVTGEFLQRRVRELVRREAPTAVLPTTIAQADASPFAAGETRWVRYAPSDIWLPYAVSAGLAGALDRALDSDGVLAELGPDGAAALLEASGAQRNLQPAVAELRVAHGAREHCALSSLLPELWPRAVADYYSRLVAQGFWAFDDGQSARYWAHNEPVARILHRQLAPVFAQIVGQEIQPSYAYSCWYVEGAQLELHTDREQCGYTASLLVDSAATSEDVGPWPLGIINPTTREITRYVQSPGETVVFCGTRYPHFRKQQPSGRVSSCVFLHYVPTDFAGPLQ